MVWALVFYRRPDLWKIALNAGAQLQVPAQRPQMCGDLLDLRLDFSISLPFSLVQLLAPLCQGV